MALDPVCSPSRLQLALALAVIKSKPASTTIRDHILGLRRHIRTGTREPEPDLEPTTATLVNDNRHVDSVAFWRESYEKSEAAQSRLLDRIYELEQKNESIRLNKDDDGPATQERATTKRKATNDEGPGPGTQKRGKTASAKGAERPKSAASREKIIADFEGPQDPVASLLRRFYNLRKILQRKINPDSLTINCIDLCTAAAKSIDFASQNSGLRYVPDLEQIMNGVEQCYPCLLQCLKKLTVQTASNSAGLIIYHMVQLFRTIVEQFHQYTTTKAKRARTGPKNSKQKAKNKSTKAAPEPTYLPLPEETQKILGAFSHLLVTMILSLDPLKAEQQGLLEGYLFVLLEYVGRTLGLFVFKDLNSNSEIRTDQEKLLLPDSLHEQPIDSPEFAVRELASAWESKYLLWILDRVMAFVERHNLTLGVETEKEPLNSTESSRLSQSRLLRQVRDKLQSTLLIGVFGDDDPAFEDSLKSPIEPPALISPASSTHDVNAGDWFAQEVWRMLGWDLLLRGSHL